MTSNLIESADTHSRSAELSDARPWTLVQGPRTKSPRFKDLIPGTYTVDFCYPVPNLLNWTATETRVCDGRSAQIQAPAHPKAFLFLEVGVLKPAKFRKRMKKYESVRSPALLPSVELTTHKTCNSGDSCKFLPNPEISSKSGMNPSNNGRSV